MLKVSSFILIIFPQLCYANLCTKIFNSNNKTYTEQLIDEIYENSDVNKESLNQLVDMVTANTSSNYRRSIEVQAALRSLSTNKSFELRLRSYELLTSNFKSELNFFDFFKTKEEFSSYLSYRQNEFEEQNVYPTAEEILSVFKNYRFDMPFKLESYVETFDQNGYFNIQSAELHKILNHSPAIYAHLLDSLYRMDSRLKASVLESVLSNPNLIENYELTFRPTLQAIELQRMKLNSSDFKYFIKHTNLNTKQGLIISDLLSFISRHSNDYMNEFVGEGGFLTPLLMKLDLSAPFGRLIYQNVFVALRALRYELSPDELQLSFSLLMSYKPLPFDLQTRLTSILRFEFESPILIFQQYLSRADTVFMLSQKNYAFQVINQNLYSVPHEKVNVEKLRGLIQ